MSTQFSTATQKFNSSQITLLDRLADGFKYAAKNSVRLYDEPGQQAVLQTVGLAAGLKSAKGWVEIAIVELGTLFELGKFAKVLEVPTYMQYVINATSVGLLAVDGIGAASAGTPLAIALVVIQADLLLTDKVTIPLVRKIAKDPLDPNFREVVTAVFPTFPVLPSTGHAEFDKVFFELLQGHSRAYGFIEALNTSFDRYTSAYIQGDSLSAALQMSAMLQYMNLVRDALHAIGNLRAQIPTILLALGFDPSADSQDYLAKIQQGLASDGLSPTIRSFLLGEGFSGSDIEELIQGLLDETAVGSAGDSLNAYSKSAALFSEFGVTATVTEPPSGLLIVIALGGVILVTWRRKLSLS